MTPEQYQTLARRTLVTDNEQDTLAMCALGIAGEAGEICDILKKHLFHKNGKPLDADKLADEAGDLLWYASILAYTLSVPMQDIMPVLTFPGGSGTSLALVAMTLTEAAGDIAFYVRVETYSYDASGETKTHGLRNLIRGLAFIAGHICLSLEDIMQRNIAKLEARHNGGNGFQAHYESDSGDSRASAITLEVYLVSKPEMTASEAEAIITNGLPDTGFEFTASNDPEAGIVYLTMFRDKLTDRQRDWLHMSDFAARYIDTYRVRTEAK